LKTKQFKFSGLKAQLITALGNACGELRTKQFKFSGLKAQLTTALGNA
jgi:hypothetical protein